MCCGSPYSSCVFHTRHFRACGMRQSYFRCHRQRDLVWMSDALKIEAHDIGCPFVHIAQEGAAGLMWHGVCAGGVNGQCWDSSISMFEQVCILGWQKIGARTNDDGMQHVRTSWSTRCRWFYGQILDPIDKRNCARTHTLSSSHMMHIILNIQCSPTFGEFAFNKYIHSTSQVQLGQLSDAIPPLTHGYIMRTNNIIVYSWNCPSAHCNHDQRNRMWNWHKHTRTKNDIKKKMIGNRKNKNPFIFYVLHFIEITQTSITDCIESNTFISCHKSNFLIDTE